jgi:hypothetical protein
LAQDEEPGSAGGEARGRGGLSNGDDRQGSGDIELSRGTARLAVDGIVGDVDGVESAGVELAIRSEVNLLKQIVLAVRSSAGLVSLRLSSGDSCQRFGGQGNREAKSDRCR